MSSAKGGSPASATAKYDSITHVFAGMGLDRSSGDRKRDAFITSALENGSFVVFYGGKPIISKATTTNDRSRVVAAVW